MRIFWIKVHLFIAAFFLPLLLLMATSGGLYLLGIKGTTDSSPVEVTREVAIDMQGNLEQQISELLKANGVEHSFEYIKVSGSTLITRPTSTTWYEIDTFSNQITREVPDLVKRLVELHKGHGPGLFKNLQKVMAVGLLVVLLTGLWLGLSSPALRLPAIGISLFGALVALTFALM